MIAPIPYVSLDIKEKVTFNILFNKIITSIRVYLEAYNSLAANI
jgi:hypothetical protein